MEFSQSLSIQAPPRRVWQAIVDPKEVIRYHLAPLKEIQLKSGGRISYGTEDRDMIAGRIVHLEIGHRLDHTFRFLFSPETTGKDPETLVSYQIFETPAGSTLTLRHSGFPDENATFANISGGWPSILDALKNHLEGSAGSLGV